MSIAVWFALAPMVATAQPSGSAATKPCDPFVNPHGCGEGSNPAAGSAAPAAGSAAPAAGSAAPQAVMPRVPDAGAPPAAAPSVADLRQTCAQAMNADPTFAESIVKTINAQTLEQHKQAADAIAKNEKHVVLAYAAFWALAALFVIFLWRRQQALKSEIAQLKRDLDAAAK